MVAILDEVELTDPVDVDRRHALAGPHRRCDALPPLADAVGGRPETAVEVTSAVHRADDRVEFDRLDAEALLPCTSERREHLVERQDLVDVVGLPPQAIGEPPRDLSAPGPREVRLRVLTVESGVGHAQGYPRTIINRLFTGKWDRCVVDGPQSLLLSVGR